MLKRSLTFGPINHGKPFLADHGENVKSCRLSSSSAAGSGKVPIRPAHVIYSRAGRWNESATCATHCTMHSIFFVSPRMNSQLLFCLLLQNVPKPKRLEVRLPVKQHTHEPPAIYHQLVRLAVSSNTFHALLKFIGSLPGFFYVPRHQRCVTEGRALRRKIMTVAEVPLRVCCCLILPSAQTQSFPTT